MKDFVKLMRPLDWVKNGFVFVGIIFSKQLHHLPLLEDVMLAFFTFCLASSSVYVFNDIVDRESDQAHPGKRGRPIASGRVSIKKAALLSFILAAASLLIGAAAAWKVTAIAAAYLLLNLIYSLWWKRVVIVDVFCIAAGFMLRILAGTAGVGVPPSKWLLLCGLMITLFLGFAKRRAELALIERFPRHGRSVLSHYPAAMLDEVLSICASGVIISYSLYTMNAATIRLHGSENLIYTVPFVIYGLFRYLYLLHRHEKGEDPARDLIRDPHILAAVGGWGLTSILIIL